MEEKSVMQSMLKLDNCSGSVWNALHRVAHPADLDL